MTPEEELEETKVHILAFSSSPSGASPDPMRRASSVRWDDEAFALIERKAADA